MIGRIHHVVIAVESVDSARERYEQLYGLLFSPTVEMPDLDIRRSVANVGDAFIELIEPLALNSAVRRHLDRRGEGVYMLSLTVDSLVGASQRIEASGSRIITRGRSSASQPLLLVHPADSHGVLIQLIEEPPGAAGQSDIAGTGGRSAE